MRIKLDENLSRHLKASLESLQHDVQTAAEENLLSKPDESIARVAQGENRMIFSLDTDFADLRSYAPGSHPGIIVFRPGSFSPLSVNRFVEDFVKNTDIDSLSRCLVIVEPGRLRIRRPI